eukprot:4449819-Pleurochrysis_carterae.AAC.1
MRSEDSRLDTQVVDGEQPSLQVSRAAPLEAAHASLHGEAQGAPLAAAAAPQPDVRTEGDSSPSTEISSSTNAAMKRMDEQQVADVAALSAHAGMGGDARAAAAHAPFAALSGASPVERAVTAAVEFPEGGSAARLSAPSASASQGDTVVDGSIPGSTAVVPPPACEVGLECDGSSVVTAHADADAVGAATACTEAAASPPFASSCSRTALSPGAENVKRESAAGAGSMSSDAATCPDAAVACATASSGVAAALASEQGFLKPRSQGSASTSLLETQTGDRFEGESGTLGSALCTKGGDATKASVACGDDIVMRGAAVRAVEGGAQGVRGACEALGEGRGVRATGHEGGGHVADSTDAVGVTGAPGGVLTGARRDDSAQADTRAAEAADVLAGLQSQAASGSPQSADAIAAEADRAVAGTPTVTDARVPAAADSADGANGADAHTAASAGTQRVREPNQTYEEASAVQCSPARPRACGGSDEGVEAGGGVVDEGP